MVFIKFFRSILKDFKSIPQVPLKSFKLKKNEVRKEEKLLCFTPFLFVCLLIDFISTYNNIFGVKSQ